MQQISIQIEDWQNEALTEMAAARGVPPESIARTLLSDQLVQQIHCAFDDLVRPKKLADMETPPSDLHIEQRLRRIFDAW